MPTEIKKKKEERVDMTRKAHRAMLNILEDINEARAKAVEEKNKTLAIITNFTDGILVFDREDCLSLINPTAENFFDIGATEVIGKSLLELSDFPKLKILLDFLAKKKENLFRKRIKIEDNLILETTTVSIKRGKETLGGLVILHDVTREEEIERMKSEFVSLAAHQLRTPLSAIKWTLKMLLEEDLGQLNKSQKDYLDKTYKSNERMIRLINDLLNVSKIEEGKYLYNPVFVNFDDLVQEVIKSYKGEMRAKNIDFQYVKTREKIPQVKVDIEKMKLAVTNLLDNAVTYSPVNGKIGVSLNYNEEEKEIRFSVQDSGIGISRNQQRRVFTKFFRSIEATKIDTEGSGLGLFIVKNVVKAHGGKIWFESEKNKGSTFYLTLPIKEEIRDYLKGFK